MIRKLLATSKNLNRVITLALTDEQLEFLKPRDDQDLGVNQKIRALIDEEIKWQNLKNVEDSEKTAVEKALKTG